MAAIGSEKFKVTLGEMFSSKPAQDTADPFSKHKQPTAIVGWVRVEGSAPDLNLRTSPNDGSGKRASKMGC